MATLMHSVLVVALGTVVLSLVDAQQPALAQSKQSAASLSRTRASTKWHIG